MNKLTLSKHGRILAYINIQYFIANMLPILRRGYTVGIMKQAGGQYPA
jgi:hypothetical protein